MEIIEKQVEKVKEVPADNYGYNYGRRDINGKANAGLTLGIIGTALGAWALFGGRRSASLLGGTGTGSGADADIAIATCGGSANGVNAPTAFQAWEKECEDTLALQAGIYNLAMTYQNNRFADRQQLNSELFSAWKSQIDADFGLYKSTRDGFDVLSAKQNQDAFNLYKSQRDSDDEIRKELSDLKAQVAINAAVRPYQDKLIQCEIDKAFTAGINYTDRKTCKAIYGEVCLPDTPVVTGYVGANQCGCPRVVTGTTPTDVYVAINSQYHDYVELFKSWFGDNVDQKIIESAIIFWFKDVDCKSRNKVVSYFKEY